MRLRNAVVAKRAYVDILTDLPAVEAAMNLLDDPVLRNVKVAQLARLDQQLAELRDALAAAGCPDFAG